MPEIFQLDFMVRAFIAGGVVGASAPMLGMFLVLRRLSLIAETLAHVAITGAAIGLFLGHFPVMVAVVVAATGAVVLERLRSTRWMASDSAMATVLYTALAVALVLVSWGNQLSVSLLGYLFGNIVTVGTIDVWATVVAGCFVLVLVGMLYSELVQSTFDADLAQVSGVPVGRTNMLLALLTGVMVTLSMRVVGGLMVGALVVFPVLAALQLHQGFRVTLLVASFMGVVSVFAGLVVSFYQDVAASGAIVLTALLILVVVTVLRTMWTFKVSQSTYVRPSKLR